LVMSAVHEPFAPDHEGIMEIAQMGDRSAEAGEAKAEENQEHLRGGAPLTRHCSRWRVASHGSTAPLALSRRRYLHEE
jgi:hypothetical protein